MLAPSLSLPVLHLADRSGMVPKDSRMRANDCNGCVKCTVAQEEGQWAQGRWAGGSEHPAPSTTSVCASHKVGNISPLPGSMNRKAADQQRRRQGAAPCRRIGQTAVGMGGGATPARPPRMRPRLGPLPAILTSFPTPVCTVPRRRRPLPAPLAMPRPALLALALAACLAAACLGGAEGRDLRQASATASASAVAAGAGATASANAVAGAPGLPRVALAAGCLMRLLLTPPDALHLRSGGRRARGAAAGAARPTHLAVAACRLRRHSVCARAVRTGHLHLLRR